MRYKIGEIFNLQMGKTPSRRNTAFWTDGTHNWISIADISASDVYINATKERITQTAISASGIKVIPEECVIMSFKLSIGKVAITTKPMYSNEAIVAFISNGKFTLLPKYLYYRLCSIKWDISSNKAVKGSTLNKSSLENLSVNFHPLAQQKQIVLQLDKISSVISGLKLQIQKLDELVKARFVEMFGTHPLNEKAWDEGLIQDVIKSVSYGTSSKSKERGDGRYPYLRMNNITYSGKLDLHDVKSIDIPDSDVEKFTVKKGDVLFNRTNSKELVGKTCVYDREEQMIIAGFIMRVRVNSKMLPEFLSAFLNTDFSKKMLKALCRTAVSQANINANEFKNIGIYIPPVKQQTAFAAFVKEVDKSKVVVQKSLEKAQQLYDSLMQQYFD